MCKTTRRIFDANLIAQDKNNNIRRKFKNRNLDGIHALANS